MNRNKSGILLRHRPSGLTGQADERRERQRNLAVAVQRLRLRMALGHSWWGAAAVAATVAAGQAVAGAQPQAPSYPRVVAVLFDALQTHDWDARVAAERAMISASQLRKVLASDATVWQAVQSELAERQLPPWRQSR